MKTDQITGYLSRRTWETQANMFHRIEDIVGAAGAIGLYIFRHRPAGHYSGGGLPVRSSYICWILSLLELPGLKPR